MHAPAKQLLLGLMIAAGMQAPAAKADEFKFILGDTTAATLGDHERQPGARIDDVDLAWSFLRGARYRWLGASVGHVEFGELHRSVGTRVRTAYRGGTLSGHLFFPLSHRLILSGEVGVMFWERDFDFRDAVGSFKANDSDASLLLGAGAGYKFTPASPLSATLRYNRFFAVGDPRATGQFNDVDRIAAKIVFAF
jgi:OmpA-like transmembrane domain